MARGKLVTPEMKEQIIQMYKTGLTYREVGEKFGISFVTVGRYVRKNGYDRVHVGSKIAKAVPIAALPEKPVEAPESRNPFRVTSRTLTLQGAATGNSYTISTESEVVEIESDQALMQIRIDQIDNFINELRLIKKQLGIPS